MNIIILFSGKLIPVLRRGDEMPASLRFINYVDARDDVEDAEVVKKLAKAIVEGICHFLIMYLKRKL